MRTSITLVVPVLMLLSPSWLLFMDFSTSKTMYKKTEMEFTTLRRSPAVCLSVVCSKEGKHNITAQLKQRQYLHLGCTTVFKPPSHNEASMTTLSCVDCRYAEFLFKDLSQRKMILDLLRLYKEKGIISTSHALYLIYWHSKNELVPH